MHPHYIQFGHIDAIKVGLKNDSQQPVAAMITVTVGHKISSDAPDEKQGQGSAKVSIDPLAEKDELLPLETSILIKGNWTSCTVTIETT
jgi:hypothetical protein